MLSTDLKLTYRFPDDPNENVVIDVEYSHTDPSTAIFQTLTYLENEPPDTTQFCLYKEFDPTALDQLLDPKQSDTTNSNVEMRAQIGDYDVTARDNGTLRAQYAPGD